MKSKFKPFSKIKIKKGLNSRGPFLLLLREENKESKMALSELNSQINAWALAHPKLILIIIIAVTIWKLAWYSVALFKAIDKKQKIWFSVLFVGAFVLNDLGILPMIYLVLNRKKESKDKRAKR